LVSDEMTLLAAEGYCAVQRIRFADDVDERLAEVRVFMRTHEAPIGSWWLCERSTPAHIEEQLVARGLRRVEGNYEIAGMLLTHEPPAVEGVVARRVATAEEYADARLLQYDVFDSPPAHRRPRGELVAQFERGDEPGSTYGVWLDGRLAAVGRAFFAPEGAILSGGATAPWARGRGAYRALVRARWDDVAARGGRALVVQASSLSAPILEGLGFEQVLQFRRLGDECPASS
jgi:hypothetical protein